MPPSSSSRASYLSAYVVYYPQWGSLRVPEREAHVTLACFVHGSTTPPRPGDECRRDTCFCGEGLGEAREGEDRLAVVLLRFLSGRRGACDGGRVESRRAGEAVGNAGTDVCMHDWPQVPKIICFASGFFCEIRIYF